MDVCPHCGKGDLRHHCPRACGWMKCRDCKAVITPKRHDHPDDSNGLCAGKKEAT